MNKKVIAAVATLRSSLPPTDAATTPALWARLLLCGISDIKAKPVTSFSKEHIAAFSTFLAAWSKEREEALMHMTSYRKRAEFRNVVKW